MEQVYIYDAEDAFSGQALADMLVQSGIPAMAVEDAVAGYGFTSGQMGKSRILVNEEDAEKASELIGGFLGTLGSLAESDQ